VGHTPEVIAALGWPRKVPYTKAMSPRLAARTAVVCILIFGTAIVRADRRPVAVIDLTNTAPGEALATELGNVLNNHLELKPIDDQTLFKNLLGLIVDEDAEHLTDARTFKQGAEERLAKFDFPGAAETATSGQDRLNSAAPTPAVVELYAELAFILGQARLGERSPKLAATAFRLAHQLNPKFTPNPARYLPEVVQAFDAARTAAGIGKIDVRGSGRVFIDGKEAGTSLAPGGTAWFDAPTGTHVVWLTGPDRNTRGTRVTVVAQQKETASIEDAPATTATKVRRARLALKNAPDASARAAAIRELASLLKVRDAVLLTTVNDKTIVQTWRDQAPGFSALRERRTEKPIDLLTPLAPPPPKKVIPKVTEPPIKIPIVEKSWYEKRPYQIGGSVGVVVIVSVIVYALRSWERHIGVEDPGFGGAETMAR